MKRTNRLRLLTISLILLIPVFAWGDSLLYGYTWKVWLPACTAEIACFVSGLWIGTILKEDAEK